MEESFFNIIKDGAGRLYRHLGAAKFALFAVLAAGVLIAGGYYAIGGISNFWTQWRNDAKMEKLDQTAKTAIDERDAAINKSNEAAGRAEQLELEKNKLETEKNEVLARYTDLKKTTEQFKQAYEADRKAKLNMSGLTTQRYNDLLRSLDELEGSDAVPLSNSTPSN